MPCVVESGGAQLDVHAVAGPDDGPPGQEGGPSCATHRRQPRHGLSTGRVTVLSV